VSLKIIMTTSMTRPCFRTKHQTCKTQDQDRFLVSDHVIEIWMLLFPLATSLLASSNEQAERMISVYLLNSIYRLLFHSVVDGVTRHVVTKF